MTGSFWVILLESTSSVFPGIFVHQLYAVNTENSCLPSVAWAWFPQGCLGRGGSWICAPEMSVLSCNVRLRWRMYLAGLAQKSHRLAVLADCLSLQPVQYIQRDVCVCVFLSLNTWSVRRSSVYNCSVKHPSMQLIYLGIILLPSLCYGHF